MTELEQVEPKEKARRKTTLEHKLHRIYILADNIVRHNAPTIALVTQSVREIESFTSSCRIRRYVLEAMADLGLKAPVRISYD